MVDDREEVDRSVAEITVGQQGPIKGTQQMLDRARRAGRMYDALHRRLTSLRLLDIDPTTPPDDRIDPDTKRVVNAGGRSTRRLVDHPLTVLLLEQRDQYVKVTTSADRISAMLDEAVERMVAPIPNADPSQPPQVPVPSVEAVQELSKILNGVNRARSTAAELLNDMKSTVVNGMASIASQARLEMELVKEDIRRVRALDDQRAKVMGSGMSTAELMEKARALAAKETPAEPERSAPYGDEDFG